MGYCNMDRRRAGRRQTALVVLVVLISGFLSCRHVGCRWWPARRGSDGRGILPGSIDPDGPLRPAPSAESPAESPGARSLSASVHATSSPTPPAREIGKGNSKTEGRAVGRRPSVGRRARELTDGRGDDTGRAFELRWHIAAAEDPGVDGDAIAMVGMAGDPTGDRPARQGQIPARQRQIPRVVWQTFSTAKFSNTAKYIETMRVVNPQYAFHLVNDTEMINYMAAYSLHPKLRDAFFAVNPRLMAARADLWRYAVLYDQGGAYVDIDSSCGSLDHFLRDADEAVISWAGGWHRDTWAGWWKQVGYTPEIDQWCLFFRPRHPLMKQVMDLAATKVFSADIGRPVQNMHEKVLRTTGPKLFMAAMDMYDNERAALETHEAKPRVMHRGDPTGTVRVMTEDYDGGCKWKVLGFKDKTLDRFAPKSGAIHYSEGAHLVFAKPDGGWYDGKRW